jgi:hypothetical protein
MPFYLGLIYFISVRIANKYKSLSPDFEYFTKGIMLKCLGAIALCLIYTKFYKGGDTTGYFDGAYLTQMLGFEDFDTYIKVVFSGDTGPYTIKAYGRNNLCCPDYLRDPQSFLIVRFTTPLTLIGSFSYFNTSIVIAALTFSGPWRLFRLFTKFYPEARKQLAIAILYVPSVLFWGSGILKDTFTFAAACWLTWSVYKLFIERNRFVFHIFTLAISAWVLISVKPYIFVALVPGALIWISFKRISNLKSPITKLAITPMIIVVGFILLGVISSSLSEKLGDFANIDRATERAIETNTDLKREAYGANSFDIGTFDGSLGSFVSLFPLALIAGLFRPFIWEANNLVMIISGLENIFLLFIFLKTVVVVNPLKAIKYIFSDPLLIFCFTFSVFFAASVGLATANFGALVRYKIPCIPFFLATLYIVLYKNKSKYQSNKSNENQQKELAST